MTLFEVNTSSLRIVMFGQSLVAYPGNSNSFLNLTRATRYDQIADEAIGGYPWASLAPMAERLLEKHADQAADCDLWMIGGTGDYIFHRTGAQCVADQEAIADTARTLGYRNVITSTTTPSTSIAGGDETERLAGNLLLIAAVDPGVTFDAVIQLAEDPLLSNPVGSGYDDGTHPSLSGRQKMRDLFIASGF